MTDTIALATNEIGAIDLQDLAIPSGRVATFVLVGAAAADEIEIQANPISGVATSISDSTDQVDVTKKIINQANNLRRLAGAINYRVLRTGGTTAISLYMTLDA